MEYLLIINATTLKRGPKSRFVSYSPKETIHFWRICILTDPHQRSAVEPEAAASGTGQPGPQFFVFLPFLYPPLYPAYSVFLPMQCCQHGSHISPWPSVGQAGQYSQNKFPAPRPAGSPQPRLFLLIIYFKTPVGVANTMKFEAESYSIVCS